MAALSGPMSAAPSAAKRVRITNVEVFNIRIHIRIPIPADEREAGKTHVYNVARVETDAGVRGYSFAGMPRNAQQTARQVLVGTDPWVYNEYIDTKDNRRLATDLFRFLFR